MDNTNFEKLLTHGGKTVKCLKQYEAYLSVFAPWMEQAGVNVARKCKTRCGQMFRPWRKENIYFISPWSDHWVLKGPWSDDKCSV